MDVNRHVNDGMFHKFFNICHVPHVSLNVYERHQKMNFNGSFCMPV